jgi:hypothetical protein
MAAATNEIERIVRKLLKEERDDTLNAIQELSEILTEQVIPKLANRGDGEADWADESEAAEEEDTDQEELISMSAFDDEAPSRRRKPGSTNGQEDSDDIELPEPDIPPVVMEAFSSFYQTLSSEQAAALAELFTTIDSELDDEGKAGDEAQPEDTRVHA